MQQGHILPIQACGDFMYVVKLAEKFSGKGADRKLIGVVITALLPFDCLAQVPITIEGLEMKFGQEVLNERNMKMDLVKAKFQDLVISFSGGDYGAINYRGKASGVEFLNLTPAQTAK